MARINIEDSLYRDPAFLKLIVKTGNEWTALGLVVGLFTLAQKHWLKSKSIPAENWQKDFDILIDLGFAKIIDNLGSVYVRGSEESFKWLDRNSKAGKSRSESKTKNLKQYDKNDRTYAEPTPNHAPNLPEALTLTLTPTLTHSQTPSSLQKNKKTPTAIKAKPDSVESNLSIGLYFTLYKNRYEGKAPLTGKHFSIIKNIIKSNGVDRTNQLLEAYFKMPDSYFIKRRHDVETFNANLNQIAHYADTGSVITNNFADTRTANNAEALRKAMESVNE